MLVHDSYISKSVPIVCFISFGVTPQCPWAFPALCWDGPGKPLECPKDHVVLEIKPWASARKARAPLPRAPLPHVSGFKK